MPLSRLFSTGRCLRQAGAALACALFPILSGSLAFAQEADPATRHEIWVPSKDLNSILQDHPDAVMLDRAQYEALIRDASKTKPAGETKPPVTGVIQGVKIDVAVSGGASLAIITAKLTVLNLVDGWVDHPLLPFPDGIRLVRVNGQNAMLRAGADKVLAVHGKGPHEVTLEFQSSIVRERTICHTEAPLLAHPVSFTVTPHGRVQFSRRWPIHNGVAEPPIASGNLKAKVTPLYWLETAGDEPFSPSTLTETAELVTRMDGAQVITEAMLHVEATNGQLPDTLMFRLPDDTSHVVSVKDSGVASWTQKGPVVEIVRTGGLSHLRSFQLTLTRPTPEADGVVPLTMDVPRLAEAGRITAYVALSVSDSFEMTGWDSAPAAADEPLNRLLNGKAKAASSASPAGSATPGSSVGARYPVAPEKIVARVRRFVDRFSADVDAQVVVGAHEVMVTRTLSFHGEEGSTVRATFDLEKGEQFLGLQPAPGEPLEWKQTGPNSFEIAWSQGLKKGRNSVVTLRSRKDVSAEAAEGKAPDKLMFENLRLPAATRLAGYVALAFDDSWKVSTSATVGLETRDARNTPVQGRMAWFGLRDYQLGVELTRNDPVLDAYVLAYALPRAKNAEIEGEFNLEVSRAPLRHFDVKLPPAIASLLRIDSPLIGGQNLDEASGVWHLTLRKELLGVAVIRWRMSLAGQEAHGPHSLPGDTVVTLPRFILPEAQHFSGEWIVEANTDTELHYVTKGVQPLDSLHVPLVEGYTPRHRVLAAYGYGLGDYEIQITATRHTPGTLINAVVQSLDLTSVLSKDGSSRHRASLRVKHNGLQFFALRLPPGATLLSATADGEAVKPVQAGPNEVRVPLASQANGEGVVLISVLYEMPGDPWATAGRVNLPPPTVEEAVPVLTTKWRVFVPPGMEVQGRGRLDEITKAHLPPLLLPIKHIGGVLWREMVLSHFVRSEDSSADFLPGGANGGPVAIHATQMRTTVMPAAPDAKRTLGDDHGADQDYTSKMARIIFPSVQFQGASLDEAVEFLRIKSKELDTERDPAKRGVNLIIRPGTRPTNATITLDLHEVPMVEALRYVTELAGMKYRVAPYAVMVVEPTGTTEQFTRTFSVPPGKLRDAFVMTSALQVLRNAGVQFPEGASAVYVKGSSQLVVKNTEPNLDAIDSIVSAPPPAEKPSGNADVSRYGNADGSRYYSDKMTGIIFPSVQFQNASLEEAIEFLRHKSKELDTQTPDPSKRGLNIIIRPGTAPSNASITMDLHNVPMIEVLRYITELSGMKYKIEPYAVVVVPPTETTTEQYTRTFRVPPNFMSLASNLPSHASTSAPDPFAAHPAGQPSAAPAAPTPAPLAKRPTAIDILQEAGIQFPEGASASFVAASSMLVVRNTQPNLDNVEAFVEALSQPGSAALFGTGGTVGMPRPALGGKAYPFLYPGSTTPVAGNPITPGLRAGSAAIVPDSINGLIAANAPAFTSLSKAKTLAGAKAGLISLNLQLPVNGRIIEFEGNEKPKEIALTYRTWESQIHRAVAWAVLGAFAFFCWGRRRPCLRTVALLLVLTCVPLIWLHAWLPVCNALAAGWLAALLIWVPWRLTQRWESWRSSRRRLYSQ